MAAAVRGRVMVLLAAVLGACAVPDAVAQDVTATLERNPIHADETVRLVVEYQGHYVGSGPELEPLDRDFEVLGSSTSTQVHIAGNQQLISTRWLVELAPRHPGRLSIPALAVDGSRTPPLTLEVLPAAAADSSARDIFLEVAAEPNPSYVQAQIRYLIRLFRSVEILDGTLSEPQAEGADVRRLGRDLSYTAMREGRRFRVIERRYALFPEASGTLTIPGIEFKGEVAQTTDGDSSMSRLFTRGKRVHIQAETLSVSVSPRPESAPAGTWLPARDLRLTESWSTDPPELRVGEPVTRTVGIQVVGLRAEQLPELALDVGPEVKVYPDQPSTQTTAEDNAIVGRREQRVALVPIAPGEVWMPEIRVGWWDVVHDAPRVAVLPGRRLAIAPAASASDATWATDIGKGETSASASEAVPWLQAPGTWQAASALLLTLWLITVLVWWRRERQWAPISAPDELSPDRDAARIRLRLACAANDPRRARQSLLAWGRAAWPESPPRGLVALGERLSDDDLRRELMHLDQSLYSPSAGDWSGKALWQYASTALKAPAPARSPDLDPLPELYPP